MSIGFLLNQTADLYAPTMGVNGIQTYSGTATLEDVKCRVEYDYQLMQSGNKMVSVSNPVILMDASITVTEGYKIVVNSISYYVERAEPVQGLTEQSHWELDCRLL